MSETLIPREGSRVFARILKLEDRFALCKILAVENTPLPASSHFSGIIFREHVRDYDKDNVKMHQAFAPNDIIKAQVIQEAASGGMSVQLSTAVSDEMGVKYAWSQHSGQLMVPKTWTQFQCVVTKNKEKRKVAKIEVEDNNQDQEADDLDEDMD